MNIIPGKFVEEYDNHDRGHMLFAHLVGKNNYTKVYKKMKGTKILDNSWWELRKNLPIKTLIKKAHLVKADVLTLPDFFMGSKTFRKDIRNCLATIKKLDKDIKIMGVVKGNTFEEELECFKFLNSHVDINMVAIPYPIRKWDEWRRKEFLDLIDDNLGNIGIIDKPIHLFGVNNILTLPKESAYYVKSADTTMAFKCGYKKIRLPVHPAVEPKRPKKYFEIKKLDKEQRECIEYNLKWMEEFGE